MIKFLKWLRYLVLRAYYRRLYRKIYFVLKGRIDNAFENDKLSSEHFRLITGRDWEIFREPLTFQRFVECLQKA